MAEDRMAVLDTVRKAITDGDVDSSARACGCSPRRSWRRRSRVSPACPRGPGTPSTGSPSATGTGERRRDTRVGTIEVRVPRVRDGSYFPALLEPRTRGARALVAVVQ